MPPSPPIRACSAGAGSRTTSRTAAGRQAASARPCADAGWAFRSAVLDLEAALPGPWLSRSWTKPTQFSPPGQPFPANQIAAARDELDQLVEILENHGVRVRRPDSPDHGRTFGAPGWTSTGLYDAMPRDLLLVIGEHVIEAPMAWRSRYYASSAYRPLLRSTSAPAPDGPRRRAPN
jgi:hypothetical protein